MTKKEIETRLAEYRATLSEYLYRLDCAKINVREMRYHIARLEAMLPTEAQQELFGDDKPP
jgi:hypothetical protein